MMMIEDDTNLRFVINITALPEKNITEGSLPDLLSLLVTMISMDVELTENNSNTTTQQHNNTTTQHSTFNITSCHPSHDHHRNLF